MSSIRTTSSSTLEVATGAGAAFVTGAAAGAGQQLGIQTISILSSTFFDNSKKMTKIRDMLLNAENTFNEAEKYFKDQKCPEAAIGFKKAEKLIEEVCLQNKEFSHDQILVDKIYAARYNRAKCLFFLRQYGQDEQSDEFALGVLAMLLADNPLDYNVLNLKGFIYLKLAFIDEADEASEAKKQEYVNKAMNHFRESLRLYAAQDDIYKFLLFAQTLQAPQQRSSILTYKKTLEEYKQVNFFKLSAYLPFWQKNKKYAQITEQLCQSFDFITNEMAMIYAIAFRNLIQVDVEDSHRHVESALKYIDGALDGTRHNPAFFIEKAMLYKLQCSVYNEKANIIAATLLTTKARPLGSEKKDESKKVDEKIHSLEKEFREAKQQADTSHKKYKDKIFELNNFITEINSSSFEQDELEDDIDEGRREERKSRCLVM